MTFRGALRTAGLLAAYFATRIGRRAAGRLAMAAAGGEGTIGDRSGKSGGWVMAEDLARSGSGHDADDKGPGERTSRGENIADGLWTYGGGLALALVLTGLSFYVASGASFVWKPGIPIALVVLAVAQMGVHLVFFLHLTTGPDNTNNVLALAFGLLIVLLVLAGTLWIMSNLNRNMMPGHEMMHMQR